MAPPTVTGDLRRLIGIGIGLAVAVTYVIAARLGFRFAFVAEQITTVWAPTGIALAALLLWGRALWPAIWLGAFAANAGTEAPLWTRLAPWPAGTRSRLSSQCRIGLRRFRLPIRLCVESATPWHSSWWRPS